MRHPPWRQRGQEVSAGQRPLEALARRQDKRLTQPWIPDAVDAASYSRVPTDVGPL